MTSFVHSFSSRPKLCLEVDIFDKIRDIKLYLEHKEGLPADSYFFICNGKIVADNDDVQKDAIYYTHLRICGGKGGFGSMLRAIGAQIEKTTNREACRDLSGRRMRDVNNEKDLKDWLAKQSEREREREQRRQERIARRRAMPNHKFEDPLYDQQRSLLAENQEDALQTGLKKVLSKEDGAQQGTSSKRKSDEPGPSGSGKKTRGAEWLGLDIDGLSDLSEDGDEEDSDGSDSPRLEQTDQNPGLSSSTDTDESNSSGPVPNTTSQGEATSTEGASDIFTGDGEHVSKENVTKAVLDNKKGCEVSDKMDAVTLKAESSPVRNQAESKPDDLPNEESSEELSKPFNLDDITNVEELHFLGLDGLKSELMSRGLKCGGTLEQRAERLFSVKGLTQEQIDPSLFAKSKDGKNVKGKKK